MNRPQVPVGSAIAMKALYEAGYTIREIQEVVGYSYGGTRNALLRTGTELRRTGRQPRKQTE